MRTFAKRLRVLEDSYAAQRNSQGLTLVDVLRQRYCWRQAEETGRPFEELLREQEMKAQAFWETYDGDRSLAGILRSRFARRVATQTGQVGG